MYIFKNAWISILRNKGRNILIAVIIIVISAACAVTLAIRNSADKIVDTYNNKYNVEASIGIDRESLMESLKGSNEDGSNSQEEMINKFNNIENVTVDEIKLYGDSEYVSSYYYIYNINMSGKNINEATDSLVKETTTTTTKTEQLGGANNHVRVNGGGNKTTTTTTKREEIFNEKAANGAFTLMGYSSYDAMSDFIEGNYVITEGEVSSDFTGNGCVISEELASLNEITVGNTIILVNPDNEKLTYEFVVTGIYKENTDEANDMTNMFSKSVNTIITNAVQVEKILADDEDLNVTVTPTYILTNADAIDNFKDEVKEKGLSDYYTVTDNLVTVDNATKSITNVKTFATTFLVITLIIGAVVLLVINMINIRERKYEIGVLRTIGMKKSLVIGQFMIELLVVSLFALLVGAGIGASVSVKVANSLLQNEINNATSDYEAINQNFGGAMDRPTGGDKGNLNGPHSGDKVNINGLVNIEQVNGINAVVDLKVLLELLVIGIGLSIISSITACVAIARFSALAILKERS